jgi:Do/DeqQ family serine protease
MKYFVSLLSASVLGAILALAGVWWLAPERMLSQRTDQAMAVQTSWHNTSPLRPGPVPADFTEPSEKAMPAVVHISATGRQPVASNKRGDSFNPFRDFFGDNFFFGNPFDRGPQTGTGSGVIYTSDGYIITNNHVIDFAETIEVTLYDNRKFKASLVGADAKTDLAVLKIEAGNLPTLELADSDKAKVGQWVLAVGNPFDLTSTVTAGIISAKGRNIRILKDRDAIESFIQTDAAVNPGNSGGALVDDQGRLLGINTAIATQTGSFAGYSFAIPANLMRRIVDDLMAYGSFQRPYLGINIYDLDSEAARELNITISQGVVVESLVDGGSAQFAGLQPKDVITKVDDRPIKNTPSLQEIVSRAKVGDVLRVAVVRRGEELEIPVPLRAAR